MGRTGAGWSVWGEGWVSELSQLPDILKYRLAIGVWLLVMATVHV